LIYANPAFIEVSGFTRDELIGKPHNIIRHPDMPPAAFADLWKTLKEGKPWLGVVKNRRKDGGFYWVLANAYPVIENGEVTGYASVRVKPSDEQIRAADAFYAAVNAGRASGYGIVKGQRARRGWRRLLNLAPLPFRSNCPAGMARMALAGLLAIGAGGYFAAAGGVPPQWQWIVWPALGLLTAGMLAQGWVVSRKVLRSVEHVAETARQISAGN